MRLSAFLTISVLTLNFLSMVVIPTGYAQPAMGITHTYLPNVLKPPIPVTLLANGDFEQGERGWRTFNNHSSITTKIVITPHSGTHVALLTSAPVSRTVLLERMVVIPYQTPYLSFWLYSASTAPDDRSDFLTIGVQTDVAPNPYQLSERDFYPCATNATNAWKHYTMNTSYFVGRTVFLVIRDYRESNLTQIYVDDIGWQAVLE